MYHLKTGNNQRLPLSLRCNCSERKTRSHSPFVNSFSILLMVHEQGIYCWLSIHPDMPFTHGGSDLAQMPWYAKGESHDSIFGLFLASNIKRDFCSSAPRQRMLTANIDTRSHVAFTLHIYTQTGIVAYKHTCA